MPPSSALLLERHADETREVPEQGEAELRQPKFFDEHLLFVDRRPLGDLTRSELPRDVRPEDVQELLDVNLVDDERPVEVAELALRVDVLRRLPRVLQVVVVNPAHHHRAVVEVVDDPLHLPVALEKLSRHPEQAHLPGQYTSGSEQVLSHKIYHGTPP